MRWIRHVMVFERGRPRRRERVLGGNAEWTGVRRRHVPLWSSTETVYRASASSSPPNHVPPKWPEGDPQQVHIDLHVDDPQAGHDRAIELGARIFYADDLDSAEGHRVYADPAGHPFFIGWGHPDEAALRAFVERQQ